MVVRNIISCFLLSIPALVNVFLNGYIFGNYLEKSITILDENTILTMTLPHAPFELPALFMSAYISVELSIEIFLIFLKNKNITNRKIKEMAFLCLMTVIFIFIGAVVEYLIIKKN